MPSPFPGMDPFLEHPAWWPDFHDRLINSWSEVIADKLPPGYDACIQERVYLTEPDEASRQIVPDVTVERNSNSSANPPAMRTAMESGAAVLEPVTLPLVMMDPTQERYIEIRTLPDREVIAVLEVLSPSNKSGRGRVEYLDKRDELLRTPLHLVEVDLLLGGMRLPMGAPLPPADYYAFVSRGDRRPDCRVYGWKIPGSLPMVPVPLRPPDGEIQTDLKAAFDMAYARGRFERRLDYRDVSSIPVPLKDRPWVAERAAAGG
jgi:hypothetical protein